jgi:hypothetical protein
MLRRPNRPVSRIDDIVGSQAAAMTTVATVK